MFGLTEFNVFKDKRGYYIALVTGKRNNMVLKGSKRYTTSSKAYDVALLWWKKMLQNSNDNALPVRMADF